MDLTIRPARLDDAEAVRAFAADTWPEHGGDYVPRVFESWARANERDGAGDGPEARTLVAADADDRAVGLLRTVLLTPSEAWCGGMRVDPDLRGEGAAVRLSEAGFDWARQRGATVARCMVFSWNAAGLGAARAVGFEPATEFRWAHPTPDTDRGPEAGADAADVERDAAGSTDVDPDATWQFWLGSEAREHLDGLALDPGEPWALSSLSPARLADAAEEGRLVAVGRGPDVHGVGVDGVRGFAVRVRVSERESDETGEDGGADPERWAEYGVAAWANADVAADLLDAVALDAASVGADRTRVLVPETARAVSDAALARVEVADSPDFVLAADLTARE